MTDITRGGGVGPSEFELRTLDCPNDGEAYKTLGEPTPKQHHEVSTESGADIKRGELVWVVRASCPCGWSDVLVIDDE